VTSLTIDEAGTIVWLKGSGQIKVFRLIDTKGNAQHWATNKIEMSQLKRFKYASYSWQIEQFHRSIKQFCLIERAMPAKKTLAE
jgi:putative transposase